MYISVKGRENVHIYVKKRQLDNVSMTRKALLLFSFYVLTLLINTC